MICLMSMYVSMYKQEEEEDASAAQNDTAEEKLPGSGSDESDDDNSVRPPEALIGVINVLNIDYCKNKSK